MPLGSTDARQGKSEEVVGQVLSDLGFDETRMLVATKVRLRTGQGPNEVGLGRSHIMRSVERSLKRIGRDHIDLFQLHDRDALVPIEETLRALDDLVTQGKVRHIGVCNFSAGDLERVHGITACTHWTRVVSNQDHYSLTEGRPHCFRIAKGRDGTRFDAGTGCTGVGIGT
ncbi:aldo/keto reductase [Paraburkholderia sp. SIMBA_030]|uniref:aldo/keto reductase n=1 Tax=Paraburkholderia sp. SIMBA_030 TaxID=3085773 RepID=UPI00397A0F18